MPSAVVTLPLVFFVMLSLNVCLNFLPLHTVSTVNSVEKMLASFAP